MPSLANLYQFKYHKIITIVKVVLLSSITFILNEICIVKDTYSSIIVLRIVKSFKF